MTEKLSFKEFKERVNSQDGFGKMRRIIYCGWNPDEHNYNMHIPMIGKKDQCLKVAYRLIFGENLNEYEQQLHTNYINKFKSKIHISYSFGRALDLDLEVKWENNQIVEP